MALMWAVFCCCAGNHYLIATGADVSLATGRAGIHRAFVGFEAKGWVRGKARSAASWSIGRQARRLCLRWLTQSPSGVLSRHCLTAEALSCNSAHSYRSKLD